MKWKVALLAAIVTHGLALGQTDSRKLTLLIKGGIADYAGLYYGSLGGGNSMTWGAGPIIGGGVEYPVSRVLKLQGVLEYSWYHFKPGSPEETHNNPHCSIVELSANTRWAMGIFYIIGGLALCHEHHDEVLTSLSVGNPTPEFNETRITLNLGVGFSVNILSGVNLFLEGTLRTRYYATPVAQLGTTIQL